MKATVIHYLTPDRKEAYSIGGGKQLEEIKKTSLQVIRTLDIEVSEQERYELGDYSSEQLLAILEETMNVDLFTTYPN